VRGPVRASPSTRNATASSSSSKPRFRLHVFPQNICIPVLLSNYTNGISLRQLCSPLPFCLLNLQQGSDARIVRGPRWIRPRPFGPSLLSNRSPADQRSFKQALPSLFPRFQPATSGSPSLGKGFPSLDPHLQRCSRGHNSLPHPLLYIC
jgi:hypothetical protein